jgi:ligand-binding sensor domain-containing protein
MIRQILLPLCMATVFLLSCDREEPEIAEQIAGNRVVSICIDNEGIVWCGTENGLSAFDGSAWYNYSDEDGLPEHISDITSRVTDSGTEIVLGTAQGAGILGKVSTDIQSVSILLSSNSGLAGDRVSSLTNDGENVTWFGTDEGISIQHEGEWMDGEENAMFRDYPITAIAAGPDTISFVCLSGLGIALMHPGVDAVTTATYYTWPYSPFPSDNIQAIYVDGYEHQWIGTDKGLAFHGNYDPKTHWELYYEENGLINNNVLSIQGDGKEVTWIGTCAGVSRYEGGEWTNYTTDDGLAGDSVFSIALDKDGSVWFGTNGGASRFDGQDWSTFVSSSTTD